MRRLVEAGVLQQQTASDGTAYQEYVLSAKGEDLFPVVVALRQWGEQHLFGPDERHSELIDTRSGRAVARMSPRAENGRPLTPAQTQVRKLS